VVDKVSVVPAGAEAVALGGAYVRVRVYGGAADVVPLVLRHVSLLVFGATNVYKGILAGEPDASTSCATARPHLRLSRQPCNCAIPRQWKTRNSSCSPSARWSRSARRSCTSTRGERREAAVNCTCRTSSRRRSWSPDQRACESGGGGAQGVHRPCLCQGGCARRRVRARARVRGGGRRGAPGAPPRVAAGGTLAARPTCTRAYRPGRQTILTSCATARPHLRLSGRPFNCAISRRRGTRTSWCSPSARWSRSARR